MTISFNYTAFNCLKNWKKGNTLISILKTHQLDIDKCYQWSTYPLRSCPFTIWVNLKVFCGVWDNGEFLIFFSYSWIMLFHILKLIILCTIREGGNTNVFYHPSIAPAMLPLGIHHFANHAKSPPFNPTPHQTHFDLSPW